MYLFFGIFQHIFYFMTEKVNSHQTDIINIMIGVTMRSKIALALAATALLAAQLACNMPGRNASAPTQLPAPNQTLTALFAFTPQASGNTTATSTLPPVFTATSTPTATITATLAPIIFTPTNTQPAPVVNTPTPTTVVKPPTATIPGVRPRSPVVAQFLNTPPTLDGDWSEWKDLTKEYPAGAVVYGSSNWANDDDLEASFHAGWDNNYLYIAIKVRDEKYVQNASGEIIYKGDGLELLLDTKLQEDYYYQQLSADDFQLGISPGRPDPNGTREAYLWFPSNIAGARGNVQDSSRLGRGVYRVEAAIPWSVFDLCRVDGRHYGFAISVNDNDDPNNNVQQSMVSNVAGRQLTNPTTWGDLQLVK
jgi:hypothetical protein